MKDKRYLWLIVLFAAVILAVILLSSVQNNKGSKKEIYKGDSIWEESVDIVFRGTYIAASRLDSVHIADNKLTILDAGTYVIRGNLEEGQIIVDAEKNDEVVLKFNNVSVHCSDSSPLWIRKARKVKIRLMDDSENFFSDGVYYVRERKEKKQPKACIDARCDLSIKGDTGSLIVESHFQDGIYSSDDLKIKSGTIRVSSERDALSGKDSLQIGKATLIIEGKRDGIHSKGYIKATETSIDIDAIRYGIYAFSEISIDPSCQVSVRGCQSPYGCRGKVNISN